MAKVWQIWVGNAGILLTLKEVLLYNILEKTLYQNI